VAGFERRQGELVCDGIGFTALAATFGTPLHTYSADLLTGRYRAFAAPLAHVRHRVHYAVKANSTLEIVRHLRNLGAGADVNSGGELEVALRAGFQPADIVFTGVGKTPDELERAITLGVHALNAESPGEVSRIAAIAARTGRAARVAIRINPDVDAGSHPHISTGSRATKFGMAHDEARAMAADLARHPHVRLVGLHVHIGSQITTTAPLVRAAETVADLAREVLSTGAPLEHVDLGGGVGIAYQPGQPALTPDEYAAAVLPAVASTGLALVFEPGRWIVGPAGVLLTRVVDLKARPNGGVFVIVDAGMTDLMRPALYGAWHDIEAVSPRSGRTVVADVVGPVCETTDTFAKDRTLGPVEVGDLLVIRDTGAYGSVMASNYNRRPMAAEVLVEHGEPRLVRRRQTIDEMLQWEM
jgi:diaminopimelate decarboxylase